MLILFSFLLRTYDLCRFLTPFVRNQLSKYHRHYIGNDAVGSENCDNTEEKSSEEHDSLKNKIQSESLVYPPASLVAGDLTKPKKKGIMKIIKEIIGIKKKKKSESVGTRNQTAFCTQPNIFLYTTK